MNFTKYDTYGAYHWKQYVRGTKYRKHADFIKSWVAEENVLDVGAGDGLITYLLRATGIDVEPKALEIAQTLDVDVSYGSAYDLPFPDNSFNAVTMFDVIEHLDNPEVALKEARRVAPILYLTTPERGSVNDPFHVREWLASELPDFMAENGWLQVGDMIITEDRKTMYARFKRYIPDTEQDAHEVC